MLPLKVRYMVFLVFFLQLRFQRNIVPQTPIQLMCSQSKIKDKGKKKRQVKEGMSSPIECFTALLRGQNMFKIPLLPCVWQVTWGPRTKTVVPVLHFEYTCEKWPPGDRWSQTQITPTPAPDGWLNHHTGVQQARNWARFKQCFQTPQQQLWYYQKQ